MSLDSGQSGPKSPCVNVCVLDTQGFCRGCYRTLDEIAAWPAMSASQQRLLLGKLDGRRLTGTALE
jgi:uncharacterized protein